MARAIAILWDLLPKAPDTKMLLEILELLKMKCSRYNHSYIVGHMDLATNFSTFLVLQESEDILSIGNYEPYRPNGI
jgi:hypothetical protein